MKGGRREGWVPPTTTSSSRHRFTPRTILRSSKGGGEGGILKSTGGNYSGSSSQEEKAQNVPLNTHRQGRKRSRLQRAKGSSGVRAPLQRSFGLAGPVGFA